MNKEFFVCPSGDFDCPYYDANGNCMMYPEFNPIEECDDAYYYYGDEEEED